MKYRKTLKFALKGGSPQQWTPAKLPLRAWYNETGKYQNTLHTTPAIAQNDPVNAWLDSSGNGNHLIAEDATVVAKHLDLTGPALGMLKFDGTLGQTLGVTFSNNQPISYCFVLKTNTVANKYFAGDASGNSFFYPKLTGLAYAADVQIPSDPGEIDSGSGDVTQIAVVQVIVNGASSKIRYNQTTWGTGSLGSGNLSGFRLGGYTTGSGFDLACSICEVVVVAGVVSDTDMDTLFNYEAAKWFPPNVASLSVNNGYTSGNQLTTLTGTNFSNITAVNFGTTPALWYQVVNTTTIIALVPPVAAAGAVTVTVANSTGTGSGTTFTYNANTNIDLSLQQVTQTDSTALLCDFALNAANSFVWALDAKAGNEKVYQIDTSGNQTAISIANGNLDTNGVGTACLDANGNYWVFRFDTITNAAYLTKITPGGTVTHTAIGTNLDGDDPVVDGMCTGPGGYLYLMDDGPSVNGRPLGDIVWVIDPASPSTPVARYRMPKDGDNNALRSQVGCCPGPGNMVWFSSVADTSNKSYVGKMDQSGNFTFYLIDGTGATIPQYGAQGPDGNVWFSTNTSGTAAVGKITPTGTWTAYTHAGLGSGTQPIIGPDNNLYFGGFGNTHGYLIRVTTAGVFTESGILNSQIPSSGSGTLAGCIGSDGDLWMGVPGVTNFIGKCPYSVASLSPTAHYDASQSVVNRSAGLVGYTDGAVSLDATFNRYLSVASNNTIQAGSGDMFVSFWVKTTNNNNVPFSKGGSPTANQGYGAYFTLSSTMQWFISDGTTQAIATTAYSSFTNNTWTHVVCVVDRNANLLKTYINGSVDANTASIAGLGSLNGTSPFAVGALDSGGSPSLYFSGLLSDVILGFLPSGTIHTQIANIVSDLYAGGSGLKVADLTSTQKSNYGITAGYQFTQPGNLGADTIGSNNMTPSGSPQYTFGKSGMVTELRVDGEAVNQFNDQSVNGHSLLQAIALDRPLYKLNRQNGLPGINFDGSNQYVQGSFALNQPVSVYAVVKLNTNTSSPWMDGVTTSLIQSVNGSVHQRLNAGSDLNGPTVMTVGTVYTIKSVANGNSSIVALNGAADTTGAAGANNTSGVTLGADKGGASGTKFPVEVYEIIVLTRVLSAAEEANLYLYLRSKWGHY